MENTNMFVKQVSASGSFGSQFREFVASKQVNTQQTSHALYGNASSSHYRASYLFAPDTPQRPITEKNDSVTEPQCATDVKLKRQKTFHRSQGVSNVAHKFSSIIPGYNPRKFRAQHTDASNANKHSFTESSDFASGSFGSQFRQFVSNTQITHTSRAPRTCSPYAHKHPTVTIPSSESHKSKLVNFSSPIQSSLSETSHSINEEVLHMEEHPPEAHEHSCSTGNNEFHTLQTDASDGLSDELLRATSSCSLDSTIIIKHNITSDLCNMTQIK
ncbi:uncharacterized protein LOC134224603 isoform X2 [Armigeres subalbatus]|uniref:uncharacterized protein LOC134224603 isoform X2 n=1 Tax=Armigeres subalbatus TaxID=124917 RepID=UPI002ED02503